MHPALASQLTPVVIADRERDVRAARSLAVATRSIRLPRRRHVDEHGGLRGASPVAPRTGAVAADPA